jgi:AcrR family transcriptional regulator
MSRLKKTERREQIIDRATEVFMRDGLTGARTREIARVCGINEALLYKHFESKEELFRVVIKRIHDEITKTWAESAAEAPDGRSALLKIIELHQVFMGSNAGICASLIHGISASAADGKTRDMVREWFKGHHDFIASLTRRGIDDGSLPTDVDPEQVAWWVRGAGWAAILATFLIQGDDRQEHEGWDAYRSLVEYLSANHMKPAPED